MTFNELLELDRRVKPEQTEIPTEKAPSGRPDVSRSEPTSGGKKGTSNEAPLEQPSERPSGRTKERLTARRPYDFFRDQVLWLNKTKVEIQERYGRRVTATAMVQLALDLFIQDYKTKKERSKLVSHLVADQGTMGPPIRSSSESPSEGN